MAGSSNFLEFDTNQTNIMTDANYNNSSVRSGGVVEGIADPLLHNKLFRQSSVMTASIGQWLASLGYTVNDTNVNNLALVLANIITSAGGTIGGNLTVAGTTTLNGAVNFGSTATLSADPTVDLQAATKHYVDNHIYTLPEATTSVLGGVKVGTGLNVSSGVLSSLAPYIVSQSLTTNGYRKWSDGLIEQWGYQASTNSIFSFPIPFTSGCLNFMASNANQQGANVDNAFGYPISASAFYLATKRSDDNTVSVFPCYWTAKGV
jgi:hypothetical protein